MQHRVLSIQKPHCVCHALAHVSGLAMHNGGRSYNSIALVSGEGSGCIRYVPAVS